MSDKSLDDMLVSLAEERKARVRHVTLEPNRDYPYMVDIVMQISENSSTSWSVNAFEIANLRDILGAWLDERMGVTPRD